ncbi:hypothetical protein F4778DRAFT_283982 [Xylariomycetidae sp. FL2044]|nr:hypothetical protein F4778DRAFT_283982 [Xylariomycetidae sp. FL2044]
MPACGLHLQTRSSCMKPQVYTVTALKSWATLRPDSQVIKFGTYDRVEDANEAIIRVFHDLRRTVGKKGWKRGMDRGTLCRWYDREDPGCEESYELRIEKTSARRAASIAQHREATKNYGDLILSIVRQNLSGHQVLERVLSHRQAFHDLMVPIIEEDGYDKFVDRVLSHDHLRHEVTNALYEAGDNQKNHSWGGVLDRILENDKYRSELVEAIFQHQPDDDDDNESSDETMQLMMVPPGDSDDDDSDMSAVYEEDNDVTGNEAWRAVVGKFFEKDHLREELLDKFFEDEDSRAELLRVALQEGTRYHEKEREGVIDRFFGDDDFRSELLDVALEEGTQYRDDLLERFFYVDGWRAELLADVLQWGTPWNAQERADVLDRFFEDDDLRAELLSDALQEGTPKYAQEREDVIDKFLEDDDWRAEILANALQDGTPENAQERENVIERFYDDHNLRSELLDMALREGTRHNTRERKNIIDKFLDCDEWREELLNQILRDYEDHDNKNERMDAVSRILEHDVGRDELVRTALRSGQGWEGYDNADETTEVFRAYMRRLIPKVMEIMVHAAGSHRNMTDMVDYLFRAEGSRDMLVVLVSVLVKAARGDGLGNVVDMIIEGQDVRDLFVQRMV